MAALSETQRERIALILADLIRLDDSQIAFVETIVVPLNKPTTAPILPVVAPQTKKNS
jgi:hypothetical protein